MCVVEAKGAAGGICVMWKSGLSIHQVEFNKNLIAIKVSDAFCDWIMVGFYATPPPSSQETKSLGESHGISKFLSMSLGLHW